jgi:hypothetical protein
MKYWFETEDAERFGLVAASVLAHLKYWIDRNTSAGEEPCMTQGMKEMNQYLPFLTVPQIKTALKKLEAAGAIYRRDENVSSKGANCPIEGTELSHVLIETNTSKRTRESAREDLEYQRPTEEEVVEYLVDIGGADLAPNLGPAFYNYYEANGWMVNGTPIAKWKPKARQWLSNERNRQSNDRRKGFNPKGFTPDGLKDFIANG